MKRRSILSKIATVLTLTICISVFPGQMNEQKVSAATLPAAYDSRDYGYITSKKDQSPYGTCWAFASTAASEASLIKSGLADKDIDLSEYHLSYYMYATGLQGMYEGGDSERVITQYSSWRGPVSESVMPYTDAVNKIDPSSDLSNQCEYHLKDAIIANTTIKESADIKELIMEYGAVYAGVSVGLAEHYRYKVEYNDEKFTTYHRPNKFFADHAVCIVGWDDNFPKENFNVQPENDGAWLVKDSDGFMPYTWVSYESYIKEPTAFVYESVDKLKYVYSYNESSVTYPISGVTFSSADTITSCMNVFNVEHSQNTLEKLESVMIRNFSGCKRQICIYVNPVIKDGQIISYEYKSKPFSYTSKYWGASTVDVPEDIYLNPGDCFAVEVSGDNMENYPATERMEPYFTEYLNKGESYVGVVRDGKFSYKDIETFFRHNGSNEGGNTGNFCITAYTNPTTIKPNTENIRLDKTTVELEVNESDVIHGSIGVPAGTLGGVSYASADPEIVTVDQNGKITAKKLGTTTVYAKATYGTSVTECKVTVVPTLATSITMESNVNLSTSGILHSYRIPGVSGLITNTHVNTDTSTYTYQLHPVIDDAATNKNVTYESSDTSVAYVDIDGKITAGSTVQNGSGTAVITARTTDGSNLSASCTVNVTQLYDPNHIFVDTENQNNGSTGPTVNTNTPVTTPPTTVPSVTQPNATVPKTDKIRAKRGTSFTSGNFKYLVMNSDLDVEVTVATNKKATSLKIPATVKYNGVNLKVTGINQMAFSGLSKLKSISLGKNMERIEKKAFSGCKNLKTIKVLGDNVRLVQKNAFKGIPADVTVTVPKEKSGKYKKLLTNAGAKVSWKIK